MARNNKLSAADPYFDLVREFPLRRLKSASGHAQAIRIYRRTSRGKIDRGTRDYLDVLVDLIGEYEKRANLAADTSKVNVAELIRHRLEERGMSVSALARALGISQPNLSDMFDGRRDWSTAAIRALVNLLNIRAERFLVKGGG